MKCNGSGDKYFTLAKTRFANLLISVSNIRKNVQNLNAYFQQFHKIVAPYVGLHLQIPAARFVLENLHRMIRYDMLYLHALKDDVNQPLTLSHVTANNNRKIRKRN